MKSMLGNFPRVIIIQFHYWFNSSIEIAKFADLSALQRRNRENQIALVSKCRQT